MQKETGRRCLASRAPELPLAVVRRAGRAAQEGLCGRRAGAPRGTGLARVSSGIPMCPSGADTPVSPLLRLPRTGRSRREPGEGLPDAGPGDRRRTSASHGRRVQPGDSCTWRRRSERVSHAGRRCPALGALEICAQDRTRRWGRLSPSGGRLGRFRQSGQFPPERPPQHRPPCLSQREVPGQTIQCAAPSETPLVEDPRHGLQPLAEHCAREAAVPGQLVELWSGGGLASQPGEPVEEAGGFGCNEAAHRVVVAGREERPVKPARGSTG